MEDIVVKLCYADIFEIISLAFSIGIIAQFLLAFIWGIQMMYMKHKNRFGWCPEMLVTYESLLWIALFSYVVFKSVQGQNPIDSTSFGAVYIRPVIFITSSITAILQKRRYEIYKHKAEGNKTEEIITRGG